MRIALALFLALAAVGCGDDAFPTAPTQTVPTNTAKLSPETEQLLIDASTNTHVILWGD